MAATVREFVREIQREVRDTDLLPDRASALLNQVTSLIGNVNDELRVAEMDYKRVLLASMQAQKAANRARIEAETSPEYARFQEAKHVKELTVELSRSLRHFVRIKTEEMRLS